MSIALDGCQITPGVLIEPVDCELPGYGLYSVAEPQPLSDLHAGVGGYEWQPYDCEMAEEYCSKCTTPGDIKAYHSQADLKHSLPFEVYGSFKCSGPGWSFTEMEDRARKNLELGEARRVERHFIHSLQNVAGGAQADWLTTDLTPASGPLSMIAGIAALEDYAGEHMACLPTIHTPRGIVAYMAAASIMPTALSDTKMRTYTGTLIAAGGGYDNQGPDGLPAADGSAWLYITGPVHIWRGGIVDVPGQADAYSHLDRTNNDLLALAERSIVTGYECRAAAVRVSLGNPFGNC